MWFLYVLFGIIGGVFCGLGMGGGTLLVPLVGLLGVPQKACQVINLVSFILSSSVALVFHFKNGLVEKKGLFTIITPACFFALLTSVLSVLINGKILKRCFGVFLLIIAIGEIIKIIIGVFKEKLHKKSKKI